MSRHLPRLRSNMEYKNPQLQSSEDSGDRPRIKASGSVGFVYDYLRKDHGADCALKTSKYKPGTKVYLDEPGSRSLAGPYLVSSVPSTGKYVLCLGNGDKVKDGREFEEKDLSEA